MIDGIFAVVLSALLGACLGSFWGCVWYRIPNHVSLMGNSFCPSCGKEIPFYNNIPVLSFLILRGKTACCKTKLSPHYFWFELGCVFFFVALGFINFWLVIVAVILGILGPLAISVWSLHKQDAKHKNKEL